MSITATNGDLFGRTFALTLSQPLLNVFFGVVPNGVIIRNPMRVKFKIEKTDESKPNTCSVDVYNLAPLTRAIFEKRPTHVRLDAGYPNTIAKLFEGDLIYSSSKHEGVDWITTFDVGDGDRAYCEARVNKSFSKGVKPKEVLKEAATQMGLRIPTSVDDAKDLFGQYVGGNSVRGPARDTLTKTLKGSGYGWSIQDSQLQILRNDQLRGGKAALISQATGMLGSPAYGAPKSPGGKPILTVKNLLYPGLWPGGQIKVESEEINGFFRMSKVVEEGDTFDKDWYSTIEGTEV